MREMEGAKEGDEIEGKRELAMMKDKEGRTSRRERQMRWRIQLPQIHWPIN